MPEFQARSVTRAIGFSETKTKKQEPLGQARGCQQMRDTVEPKLGRAWNRKLDTGF